MLLPTGSALAFECPSGTLASYYGEECVSQGQFEVEEQRAGAEEQHEQELGGRHETGGPPTFLHVTVFSRRSASYRHPGHRVVVVDTNKWADVVVRITFHGSRMKPLTVHFRERHEDEEDEWERGQSDGVSGPWSCRYPVETEVYEIRVHGVVNGHVESGPGLFEKRTIRAGVTRSWCAVAKVREEREQREERESEARLQREAEEEQRRAEQRRAEEETAHLRRFESNCRAIGGEPVGIQTDEGPETVCRSKSGGIIPVPT